MRQKKTTRLFLQCLFALMPFVAPAQVSAIGWLNKQAHAITKDSIDLSDLAFLSRELRGKTVLGLGEASHGTHEFYVQKGRIARYLIGQLNYKSIAFEMPSYFMDPINHCLHGGSGNLKELMRKLALYNTTEIYRLFDWIKDYNAEHPPDQQVNVFGFDSEEYWYDQLTRDKRMADDIIRNLTTRPGKTIIWGHNVHLAKDTTMAHYESVGTYLKERFGSNYYVLFLDSDGGSVNVLDNGQFVAHHFEASENSFSNLFAKSKYDRFFISFRDDNAPLYGTRKPMTNIYSVWLERTELPVKPGIDFDGLVFLRNTTPSIRND